MKKLLLAFCLIFSFAALSQMLNDTPFDATISHPKYAKGKGPAVLFEAGHFNFIVQNENSNDKRSFSVPSIA